MLSTKRFANRKILGGSQIMVSPMISLLGFYQAKAIAFHQMRTKEGPPKRYLQHLTLLNTWHTQTFEYAHNDLCGFWRGNAQKRAFSMGTLRLSFRLQYSSWSSYMIFDFDDKGCISSFLLCSFLPFIDVHANPWSWFAAAWFAPPFTGASQAYHRRWKDFSLSPKMIDKKIPADFRMCPVAETTVNGRWEG